MAERGCWHRFGSALCYTWLLDFLSSDKPRIRNGHQQRAPSYLATRRETRQSTDPTAVPKPQVNGGITTFPGTKGVLFEVHY